MNRSRRYSRRRFLAATAGVASAACLTPALAFGTAANSRIKVGSVGLGGRGAWIARHVHGHGGYEITAVADYFPAVAQSVGEELGVPANRRYAGLKGYQRLIDSQVEAVFLETPPYAFPDHVEAATEAGCHIYIAKPLACDVPGSLRVEKMAHRTTQAKRVFLCDFQTRTDAFYQEAIRRVHAGDIGELALLEVVCGTEGFADPPKTDTIASRLQGLIWVNDEELGGGLLVNFDIHAVDVALWIAGQRPLCALGCARQGATNITSNSPRVYSLTYQFPGSFIMTHRAEHLPNLGEDGIVCNGHGSVGFIETAYSKKVWIHSNKESYKGGESPDIYAAGMQANVETFYRSVTEGRYDNPTMVPSIDATLTTILGREAARRNGLLTWDEMLAENKSLDVDLRGLVE
jgi:predicted dehydrogenase